MPVLLRRACGLALAILAAGRTDAQDAREPLALGLVPFAEDFRDVRLELEPVLDHGTLFVASPLELHALDPETLAPYWIAGPPSMWTQLAPEDLRRLLVEPRNADVLQRPAIGPDVALAALQVPSDLHPLYTSRAERRLFAFGLDGKPRWDHAEGRNVVAPPLVDGEHVLVATTSSAAELDYRVACHELVHGKLVWDTAFSGTATRSDRFRYDHFIGPLITSPAGDLVIAQTDLGVIAALDRATGAVRWRTEYETFPAPKPRTYHVPRRDTVWRPGAPLVVRDVVLATPTDSPALLALDLVDGRLLWSRRSTELAALGDPDQAPRFDHLVAATADVLYLGGPKLARFTLPGGLREAGDLALTWEVALLREPRAPRIRLHDRALHVPGGGECRRFEYGDGASRAPLALQARFGLLVTEDAVYGVQADRVVRLPH